MAEIRKTFLFILLIFLSVGICISQTHSLRGLITIQSSGNTPIVGAQVKSRGANAARTDRDGEFTLVFIDKREGYPVVLEIIYKDYEVVNKNDLRTILRANQEEGIKIYMCKKGLLAQNRMKYYNIAEKHIKEQFEIKIKQLDRANKEHLKTIARLEKERESMLTQAKDLADKLARVNFDDVSELYKKAFEYFNQDKIKEAIEVLDDNVLAKNLQRIKELKRQTIESYMLKARLCNLDYQFDKAEKCFEIAIEEGPGNIENLLEFNAFLLKQNRYKKTLALNKKILALATKESDRAVILIYSGIFYGKNNSFPEALTAFNEALEIREKLAKDNPEPYNLGLCKTLLSLGISYKILSSKNPEQSYKNKGLSVANRAITILKKHPNLPKVKEYMKVAKELKVYFENASVEKNKN